MRVGVLYTGGKDSTYAMWRAIQQSRDIACLIILKSENPYSFMYHSTNIDWVQKLHPKALGIPVICQKTKGTKEAELADLKKALQKAIKQYKIEGVISGANASKYQQYRLETICADLGLRSIAPIWNVDPEQYLSEIIKVGFKIIITSVSAGGLTDKWLGRPLDEQAFAELKELRAKFGLNINGEGGEYETMVLDGPPFKFKIEILDGEKVWLNDHGIYRIKKAKLRRKS
ncbi:MAG: diphthine--ammonia ligase [Candidatus Nanoarchaeia archaeon]